MEKRSYERGERGRQCRKLYEQHREEAIVEPANALT